MNNNHSAYEISANARLFDLESSDNSSPTERIHTSIRQGTSRISSPRSPAFSSNSSVQSNIVPPGKPTPSTPMRKYPTSSAGTPNRLATIERALKDLESRKEASSPDPSRPRGKPTPRRVIVIEDSDDDEDVPTDIEPLESPTKEIPDRNGPIPLSADSSQSSMNTMFSRLSVNNSSQSSVELPPPQPVYPKQPITPVSKPRLVQVPASQPTYVTVPTFIEDIFSANPSPNVTHRKTQKVQEHKPVVLTSEIQSTKTVPKAVLDFSRSLFGRDLEQAVIVHNEEVQKLFDDNKIEWGTQYELARGISTGAWTWDDIRGRVHDFTGNNEEIAGKVRSIMKNATLPVSKNVLIWRELDREQAAIIENKGRGLGLMGEWKGSANWHGGQIQQLARIVKDRSTFKIVLEPMKKERSHRFARFYGSRRFLQLAIPDEILNADNAKVRDFLTKKFILCGRVFVPFHSKDGHCYMVETDESIGHTEQHWCGDNLRMSFTDFINWHNPLTREKNYNQVISKYVTRFALGLSTSVPVLEFQEADIIFIDDLTSSEWPVGKKNPPANMLMTDGCGFLNHAALHSIVKYLGYESLPAGVQGRIDGSKGFWILHPTDQSTQPKIWIRESQNKIKNSSFDRAHTIFDLLEPSRPSASIALTAQSITNVFANGIPASTLIRMMEDGLENEIGPLLEWDKPYAMVFLWAAINKLGNVSGSRTQRISTAMNRAMGLQGRDWGQDGISSDVVETADDAPTYTGRNKHSGAPLGLHESAIELIQAGFHPSNNLQLRTKMKNVVESAIVASVSKYRIPVEESLGAYIVPDPLGILKEGEIYYRFSKPRKDPRTAMLVHALEGDVLLGRYPIRLPSDMQKVKAVNVRELERWPDVVVISTQGKRSIASLLADGDMDGDELIVIWDQVVVNAFENKPFTNPPEDLLQKDFTRDIEKVEAFCRRASLLSEREANEEFQKILLANLIKSSVGLYSAMHERAIVMYSYNDPISIRLAYIFATLLDSSKSGYRLQIGVLENDRKLYLNTSADDPLAPPSEKDILLRLAQAGRAKGRDLLDRYEKLEAKGSDDRDLKHPYDTSVDYCLKASSRGVKVFDAEIRLIRAHVDAAKEIWTVAVSKSMRKQELTTPSAKSKRKPFKKDKQDDASWAAARAYAQPIADICLTPNVEEVKASFAYTLNHNFAFSVAFEELCRIKARASPGGHAPNLRIFDEAKNFSSSFLRVLNRCEDEQRA